MLKRLSFFLSIAAMSAALLSAQQSVVTIPVKQASASNSKQMFVNYCAPCHGIDGRGNGPVSPALKIKPADLTLMSRNNHGSFPALHVIAVLHFGITNPAHGSKEMPVWGSVFGQLDHSSGNGADIQKLRIHNIVEYIETLQVK